jgi:anti-sigma B factor antagonist
MSDYSDYTKEEHGDILIEVVNLSRATLRESVDFKKILFLDISLGWKKIIVDFSETDFVDSSFLGALIVGLKKVNELGGDLVLIGLNALVKDMFQLTKMSEVLKSYNTREEAIKSFL